MNVGANLDVQNEARATESKYQDEIQALKSARAADERAKASVAQQIVRPLSFPFFIFLPDRLCNSQSSANNRIATISRQLDATTTTVADITYSESLLSEDIANRHKIEQTLAHSDFAKQLSDRSRESKELEETREGLHQELAGLNAQANTRAKLQLRRAERKRKEEALVSLVEKSAGAFRRHAKSEVKRETMEAEVQALIAFVPVPLPSSSPLLRPSRRKVLMEAWAVVEQQPRIGPHLRRTQRQGRFARVAKRRVGRLVREEEGQGPQQLG